VPIGVALVDGHDELVEANKGYGKMLRSIRHSDHANAPLPLRFPVFDADTGEAIERADRQVARALQGEAFVVECGTIGVYLRLSALDVPRTTFQGRPKDASAHIS
jgi:hypothetical protein